MKKVISLVLSLITLLFCLVGCNNSKDIVLTDEDIHTDYAGVYLTLSSVDDSGEHKKFNVVWHNETNQEFTFGEDFYIEILENDEWKSVLTEDMIVESIANLFPAKSTKEKTYSSLYFDLSKEGTYRIRCEFSPGDGKRYNTWVTFEVKDSSNVKSYSVTVEDGDEFLYENLNLKYKEGEQVVIKTNIILDMSLTVYVNGKSIGTGKAIKTGDEYTHWEYYFTMPSEDVTITFEEKDGMLPPSLRDEALASRDVAWANYANGDYIEDALNFDKFGLAPGQKPDANHLPIYKFSTLAEFEAFKAKYAEIFEMNSSYDEVQSFVEATEKWAENEDYWNTYDLFVIYVMTSTCSTRDGLTDVVTDGTKVCFYVNTTYDPGEPYDEAMGGWFIITSLPKNMIGSYTEYDAVTGNP